jgi:hypothetical protein
MTALNRRAHVRLVTIPRDAEDRVTSLADGRAALCIAAGVDIDDIHPAQGWDLSDRAYRHVRDSWVRFITESSSTHYRPDWAEVREDWRRHRPDLIGDWPDWPEDAEADVLSLPLPTGEQLALEAS